VEIRGRLIRTKPRISVRVFFELHESVSEGPSDLKVGETVSSRMPHETWPVLTSFLSELGPTLRDVPIRLEIQTSDFGRQETV
jgi:hypothetical protein